MLLGYNIIQSILLLPLFPFIALYILFTPKYRSRIRSRLGIGLKRKLSTVLTGNREENKIIWLHALSVGEVTSSVPLVQGLRNRYPEAKIIFSATTASGRRVADSLLSRTVDVILDGPVDLLPVAAHFIRSIKPDCFILVETDFWPNLLLLLTRKSVPTVLVNGRVSQKSFVGYQRMKWFFTPMFMSFAALCMQTENDRQKMLTMGVCSGRLHTLGNLKFDTPAFLDGGNSTVAKTIKKQLPEGKTIFIAGSTHPGEEELLLQSYCMLKKQYPDFFMVIAPRDPKRSTEIAAAARSHDLTVSLRTENSAIKDKVDLFILNTIGELAACYSLGDIGFVGGSLVPFGGHNPIEPAAAALPVILGPHMQDFSEISASFINSGGAIMVRNIQELSGILTTLITSRETRVRVGQAALQVVTLQRGVINKHLGLIEDFL
ncbi:3-deoxy-D-manno-octulosonic acid transferase [Desulforhopalus singaporensis]|uniref:3-deoxy-D-manno-octulosonic acid transferase n=1 Tax=Desulforhopalus singaporensis TaxID=91360 RepID=A0A1H0U725_9BACT|nr:3-deoxy-D-manno-octulosonic acid transferase [Desulforhopalus singaporensis]SDP62077.1 3-deoxy-D-manno-octulosonic-acid transferase [Desulforhopalus singaporensis]